MNETAPSTQNETAPRTRTVVPDLLEWMGRAFGEAVERARPRPFSRGRAQLEHLIRALPAAIYTTDAGGRITFFNEAAAELWGCRPELGKSEFCGSWKLYWPDGRPMPHGQCPMAIALKEQREVREMEAVAERLFGYTAEEVIGKPITILIPQDLIHEEPEIIERVRKGERVDQYDTVRRRKDGSLIDISLTVSPLKDSEGRIIGASKIARDITERKRAQQQQKLLVSEMKHRIKNSLATIQAIATQTLNQHAKERDAFIARLHALGNAHDLLTSETWQSAPLHAIVTRALEPFQEQRCDRITVDGPSDLFLDSTKSVMVAMLLHELATNAVKYGALSNGGGCVNVAWEQLIQPDRVKLIWRESGGPKVSPPKQKGFGSHLIERAFGGQLGTAQLVFSPQGLSCTLEVEL